MLSRSLMLGEWLVGDNVDTKEVNWKIMMTNLGDLVFISSSRRMANVLCTIPTKLLFLVLGTLFFEVPNK